MSESQVRKVFRIQLSLPVVLLLTTLGALSLASAFYLGMVTEKSTQRPPVYTDTKIDVSAEKPLSEEDLKFFGLSERDKEQESINMEELRDLKKKTQELIKKPVKPKLKNPETPKPVTPKEPKSTPIEKTDLITKGINEPKSPKVAKSEISIAKVKKMSNSLEKSSDADPSKERSINAAYTIQVFASRNHENAKKLVEKLKKSGFEDAFIFKHSAAGNNLYRVRVGKIERSETKKLAEKLKKLKYIQSIQITRF